MSPVCWAQISNKRRQQKSQDGATNSQNRSISPPWEDYATPGGRWWIFLLTCRERTRCQREISDVTSSKIWELASPAQKVLEYQELLTDLSKGCMLQEVGEQRTLNKCQPSSMDHNSSVDSFLRAIALVCVFIEEE